ncbi:MAG: hypothetical protein GQ570_10025 [Helicobacteraceae bacterium]|nr:hypothetical protein [Helicobacteraceae bacterium]
MFKVVLGFMFVLGVAFAADIFQSVPKDRAELIQKGANKEACNMCGMDLVRFYKTSHAHGNKQFCSIHCLAQSSNYYVPLSPKVVDVTSLKLIKAKDAFYVVGSKEWGTMSRVSKYAFKEEGDAKAFQKAKGGELMSFEEAYKVALKDSF